MQQYLRPCDEERTMKWIEWNIQNYKECGFGLWSVVLIETNKLIGDCVKSGGKEKTEHFGTTVFSGTVSF